MKRIVSVTLTLVFLVTLCAVCFAVPAGAAEELTPTVIYTAVDCKEGDYPHFNTVELALKEAEKKNRLWKAEDVLEVRFDGTFVAGGHNGILFGQTTIWREDGTKLPIIIRGASRKGAVIDFDNAGGFYACANDYHFVTCTLMVGNDGTQLFAGSGNVSFQKCDLSVVTSSRVEIHDKTKQAQLFRLAKDVSDHIAEENGVPVIPVRDAWESVIKDPTSPFYHEELGYVFRAMNSTGTDYGDWTHDGDVGGGQYLNACIVFEVITRRSCVGNSFVPKYELKYGTWRQLQELAHATVVANYGEAHFDTPAPVGDDDKFSVLFPGSSTCYYYADELASLGYHAGLNMKVVNPYISSLRVGPQWTNYIEPETAGYAERIWVDSGNGAVLTSKGNQTLQEIIPRETWDAVFIYQGTTDLDDDYDEFTEDYLSEEDYPVYLERMLDKVKHAKDTYEFLRERCGDAEMYWYSAAVGPVGAFGSTTELKGYLFADNCYDGVYAGWTEEEIKNASSSLTIGDDVQYICPVKKAEIHVAGSGYLLGQYNTRLTEETAKGIKFIASGMDGVPEVLPVNTEATLIVDGTNAAVYNVAAKIGGSPCRSGVVLREGTVQRISADNCLDSPTDGPLEQFYGDMSIAVTGGTVTGHIDALTDSELVGDLSISIAPQSGKISGLTRVRTLFGTGNKTGSVSGDCTVSISDVDISGSAHLGGGRGKVRNILKNVNIAGTFIGSRLGSPSGVENTLENVNVNGVDTYGSFMGTYGTPVYGNIVSALTNCSFKSNFHGGNYSGFVQGNISTAATECTFHRCYYGGNRLSNINGSVTNEILGGHFGKDSDANADYSTFMGTEGSSSRSDTIGGTLTNRIDSATFYGKWLYGGSNYATFKESDSAEARISTELKNITATRFGGANAGKAMDGKVKNLFLGTNTITYCYGAGNYSNVGQVENHLQGTVDGMLCLGSNNGKVDLLKNYIEAGTDQEKAYGSNNLGGSVTKVENYLLGGKVDEFYGGSVNAVYKGDIENTVNGTQLGIFCGGSAKGALGGKVTNTFLSGSASTKFYGGGLAASVGIPDDASTAEVNESVAGEVVNYVYGSGITGYRGGTQNGNVYGNVTNFFGHETDESKRAVLGGYYGGNEEGGTVFGTITNHNAIARLEGSFYGGMRKGTVKNVVNYFEEGFVYGPNSGVYCGSNTTNGTVSENVTNYFNGGSFPEGSALYCGNYNTLFDEDVSVEYRIKNVFRGGSYGEVYEGSRAAAAGTIVTEIYGGSFRKGIFDARGESTLKLQPEADLSLFTALEADSLAGGAGRLLLSADASLTAKSAAGSLSVMQTEEWKLQPYLSLPVGNTLTLKVSTAENAEGNWVLEKGSLGEALILKGTDQEKEFTPKPAAPDLLSRTHDTVVLLAIRGYEYSMDGLTWQESGVFTGLTPDTEYSFYCKVTETETAKESAVSDALTLKTESAPAFVKGDTDADGQVDSDDAIHLLFHVMFPERYAVAQNVDFDGNGEVDPDDAIYLLFHVMFPERYPLETQWLWPLPYGTAYQLTKVQGGGVDLAVSEENNGLISAHAVADGKVIRAGYYSDWGNLVVIDHGDGYQSYYGHLDSISVFLQEQVSQGDVLGKIGKTGHASGVQLRLVMYAPVGGTSVRTDPMNYIKEP